MFIMWGGFLYLCVLFYIKTESDTLLDTYNIINTENVGNYFLYLRIWKQVVI